MSRESVSSCADALARQIILFGHPQPDAEILDAINEIDGKKIAGMAAGLIGPPHLWPALGHHWTLCLMVHSLHGFLRPKRCLPRLRNGLDQCRALLGLFP